jgi:hypothetical protein
MDQCQSCCIGSYTGSCPSECIDPTTPKCRTMFDDLCGKNPSLNADIDSAYYKAWTSTPFCTRELTLQVNDLSWVQQAFSKAVTPYFSKQNDLILPPSSAGKFQDFLLSFCRTNSAICSTKLDSLCSLYDVPSLQSNTNVRYFCGCHLRPDLYGKYISVFGIPLECSPLCAGDQIIPYTKGTVPQICHSNLCVIDDITFSFSESQAGDITFQEVCGGCSGSGACQCYIDGVNIDVAQSKVGDINLSQNCQGGTKCFIKNDVGEVTTMPCYPEPPVVKGANKAFLIMFVIIGIIVLIMFAIMIVLLL